MRYLGLGRAELFWVGAALLGAVLLCAVAFVHPRNRAERGRLLACLVSPALLMAVNRANNDLAVFVVVCLGLLLLRSPLWPQRALGIVLMAAAAALKYYPLIGVVVLLDARTRRELIAGHGLYLLVLVLAWPTLELGLKNAARLKFAPDWLYAFGAPVLLRDFGVNLAAGWIVPTIFLGLWGIWLAVGRIRLAVIPAVGRALYQEREFICGAAFLVGLFFLGATYVYKLIFSVWLLPWLWQEHLDKVDLRWCRVTRRLLMSVLWLEGLMAMVINLLVVRWSGAVAVSLLKLTLLISQLLTWALIACLLRFLLIYLGRRVRRLLGSQVAPIGAIDQSGRT